MSVLEMWAQPYLWAGGKCGMTAIFWWFNFKPFGIKLLGGSWWRVWQRLKWRVTAQIQYGYNGHFPSLHILSVTCCLCFNFLLHLSEFCYLSHQTWMFRRNRTCDVLKTKPTQKTKHFLVLLLFVSKWLRGLQCMPAPYHLLQGTAATPQCFCCLKIPHSVSCFARVCSKICWNSENSWLFQKNPSCSKLSASALSIKLNFAEFLNWIQIIKLNIWSLALTCKYKLLQCQQFNITSFVCFSEAFGKPPSLFAWNYFLWLPESVQVTQSLKIMSKPLLKLLPPFCLPPLCFFFHK